MRRLLPTLLVMSLGALVGAQAPPNAVTVFEGARVIVGAGDAPIENAVFIVDGTRVTEVGARRTCRDPPAPAGGPGREDRDPGDHRHAHAPGQSREALVTDLRGKAYYGAARR